MKVLKRYVLLVLLTLSFFANADECKLSNWYVSKEGESPNWAGKIEVAKSNPKVWELVTDWQLNRTKEFRNTKGDVYTIATLNADEDYVQGLSLTAHAKVRLNGKVLSPVEKGRDIYALKLKKGKNTLEIMCPKIVAKEKRKARLNLLLTLVTIDYIYPSLSNKIESAKLAIKFLGKKYRSYPAKKYLEKLNKIKPGEGSDKAIEDLRYEALVLNNPEVKFDKILLRSSKTKRFPSNWQGNSVYLRKAGKESNPQFGDKIQILNLKDKTVKDVYAPSDKKEGLMDICLDFSGKKFLYSGVDTKTNTFQIYEMNIDGTGKRQITPNLTAVDNYNAVYLPNGKILFCSSASLNSVPCVGGNDYVGNLYEINSDGTGMRQVAFDQENDWYPWVKENGRVMYHRWEYTDNSHYFTRILLEMNPDGTNNRSIYGSNSYWPNTLFYAKQIPGQTSKFVAIVSGHHGVQRAGELVVFDQSKGDFQDEGALFRMPGRGKKVKATIVDKYMAGKYPRFLHPYPLSENFYLASGMIKPSDKWALYLVDRFDNVIKLKEGKSYMFEPIPLMARKVPPVIPDRRKPNVKDATLYIQDIYTGPGLKGIDRGAVAAIRIFTYGYAYRLNGSHDALAIEGEWDTKRVLGTAPVEKDGSVMVKIPANMPISIQPLDKDGNALQVFRSWTAAQPGEVVSCIGCHEPSRMAPLSRPAIASRKPPQKLKPWSKIGRIYGFSFKREIQPILDKYCAGCHDGSDPKLPNFKDCSEIRFSQKAHFSKSYLALHPYVRRPGPESDLHVLTPMDYHTSTSLLFQKLNKGHHGVKIDDESMRQLATWVDLNVPYHGSWEEVSSSKQTCELAERTVKYKKRFANIVDNIEWMPEVPKTRPKFVEPSSVKAPKEVKIKGWPLNIKKSTYEARSISFGDQKLSFVKIPAGTFVMGSVTGERDEYPQTIVKIKKPFLMSTTEITNAEFRVFNPKHDSRYIDQQWKDHIFPGYNANKDEMPAIRVSWREAMSFAKWLGKKTGQNVNLPTEAEWEWAARSGSDKPFFFGITGYENYANLADQSIGLLAVKGVDPKPVAGNRRNQLTDFVPRDNTFNDGNMIPTGTAQYNCNPWGLYDMQGNVAEWTRSAYKPYPYKDNDGRNDVSNKKVKRVVRGGSWRDKPKYATASYRLPYQPYQKVYNVGFRVVMEFDSEKELDKAFAKMTPEKGKQKWKAMKMKVPVNLNGAKLDTNAKINSKGGIKTIVDGCYNTEMFIKNIQDPTWFTIDLKDQGKVKPISYRIVSGSNRPDRDPIRWELLGSNDNGVTWTVLDKRSGVKFKERNMPYEFKIKKPKKYSMFKLNITKASKKGLHFSEIELIQIK